jgi:hypothetical protein
MEFVRQLDGFLNRLLERGFTGLVQNLLVVVAKQQVSHAFPSVNKSNGASAGPVGSAAPTNGIN